VPLHAARPGELNAWPRRFVYVRAHDVPLAIRLLMHGLTYDLVPEPRVRNVPLDDLILHPPERPRRATHPLLKHTTWSADSFHPFIAIAHEQRNSVPYACLAWPKAQTLRLPVAVTLEPAGRLGRFICPKEAWSSIDAIS
jgi:hypothetical protein